MVIRPMAHGLRHFQEVGFALLRPPFPEILIEQARCDIAELLSNKKLQIGAQDRRTRETVSDLHVKSRAVEALIRSSFVAEACRSTLGDEADLRFSITLTKTGDHGGPVDWHQDWGLDQDHDKGHPRVSFWMALTDSKIGNGCLQVLPGSHRGELLPHEVSETSPPDLGIRGFDGQGAIPLEMAAGEILVLHPQLIHGSGPNRTGAMRMALLWSFQVPKAAYTEFWAKSGAQYMRGGKPAWAPLEAGF